MKQKKSSHSLSIQASFEHIAHRLQRYRVLFFFVLVGSVYSVIVLRINVLSQAQPDQSDITTQVAQHSLKVDPTVVQKIQQLQDNSVSVQALFDQARNNPFQE